MTAEPFPANLAMWLADPLPADVTAALQRTAQAGI
jgi:hypothetical protein